MIARFAIVSALFLGLTSAASAQEAAPASAPATAPAAAPATGSGGAPVAPVVAAPAGVAVGAAAADTAAPAAIDTAPVDPKAYRIGPEDVLDFHVWKNADISRERVPVRPDGKVSLPLVNDIQVAGLTTDQVRALIAQRLSNFIQSPEVSVTVREMHSFKVSVIGNVRMPGQYEVKSDQTVLDLIARAQSFNEFADRGDISVVRRASGKEEQIKFRYNDAIRGREGANFFVQPGDIIVVN